jgi:hypothetical protein
MLKGRSSDGATLKRKQSRGSLASASSARKTSVKVTATPAPVSSNASPVSTPAGRISKRMLKPSPKMREIQMNAISAPSSSNSSMLGKDSNARKFAAAGSGGIVGSSKRVVVKLGLVARGEQGVRKAIRKGSGLHD